MRERYEEIANKIGENIVILSSGLIVVLGLMVWVDSGRNGFTWFKFMVVPLPLIPIIARKFLDYIGKENNE